MEEHHQGGLALVFTDIEGSTALVRELRGSYGLALRVHQRMLERSFEEHRGTRVATEGDGLFVVFPTPGDAVAAAVEAQRKADHYDWPEGIRLRVRMGIHCGPVTISGGEYVGLTVHEASRICTAAHGGQILCSSAVVAAVAGGWPDETGSLRDLGVFLLRGFPEGRHLFQICADGLDDDFPSPRDTIREGGTRVSVWLRDTAAARPARARRGDPPPGALEFRTLTGDPLDAAIDVEIGLAAHGGPSAFRLVVRRDGIIEEEYDGLTVGGLSDAATIVNAHSRFIRVQ